MIKVKFKSLNMHPDNHKKLQRLAKDNYRSIVGQLQYMIDKEYAENYDRIFKKKKKVEEIGGPSGPEPTRYGDWEKNGITTDF